MKVNQSPNKACWRSAGERGAAWQPARIRTSPTPRRWALGVRRDRQVTCQTSACSPVRGLADPPVPEGAGGCFSQVVGKESRPALLVPAWHVTLSAPAMPSPCLWRSPWGWAVPSLGACAMLLPLAPAAGACLDAGSSLLPCRGGVPFPASERNLSVSTQEYFGVEGGEHWRLGAPGGTARWAERR